MKTFDQLRQLRVEVLSALCDQQKRVQSFETSLDNLIAQQKGAQQAFVKLVDLSSRSAFVEKAECILASLQYPLMQERRMLIREEYTGTFSWILENTANSDFRSWLRCESGLF